MARSNTILLLATHAAALGLGAFATLPMLRPEAPPPAETVQAGKTARTHDSTRRVSAHDLLAAYRDDRFGREAMERRNVTGRPIDKTPRQTKETSEDRAARTKDFVAALQEQLDAVNGEKIHDYIFVKALIRRWAEEDPEACMAWVGRMEIRLGLAWMDPFNALAESTLGEDPASMIAMMNNGWLKRNRYYALQSLAPLAGRGS